MIGLRSSIGASWPTTGTLSPSPPPSHHPTSFCPSFPPSLPLSFHPSLLPLLSVIDRFIVVRPSLTHMRMTHRRLRSRPLLALPLPSAPSHAVVLPLILSFIIHLLIVFRLLTCLSDALRDIMKVQKRLGRNERASKANAIEVSMEKFRTIPQNEVPPPSSSPSSSSLYGSSNPFPHPFSHHLITPPPSSPFLQPPPLHPRRLFPFHLHLHLLSLITTYVRLIW